MSQRPILVLVLCLVECFVAAAEVPRHRLEIIGADLSLDLAEDGLTFQLGRPWVEEPDAVDEPGVSAAAVTFAVSVGEVEILACWQPELVASYRTERVLTSGFDPTRIEAAGRMSVEAFDLAVARAFDRGDRVRLTPRVGPTHLRRRDWVWTEVRSESHPNSVVTDQHSEHSLWGLMVGGEVVVHATSRLDLVVDGAVRWATGDYEHTVLTSNPVYDDDGRVVSIHPGSRGHKEQRVTTMTASARAGLRVHLTASLDAEVSWMVRDWSEDGGPGTFSGVAVGVRGVW